MFKWIKSSRKRLAKGEHGQVLVVVAFAIIGIIAVMGLALDVGTMLIDYSRLRRAVDSAALAAALQIREGYDPANLQPAAEDFLNLNGINTSCPTCSVLVEYCDLVTNTPADLCPDPPRKLVRVTVATTAQLNFLAVIGITSVPIAATATSQTASIDMVLVLDRSESMTYDYNVGQVDGMGRQMRDPSVCNTVTSPNFYTDSLGVTHNYTGYCQPFDTVKDSAIKFVQKFMFEPYDRVAVVSFAKDSVVNLHFSSVKDTVLQTIAGLTVYEGDETLGSPPGSTAIYPNGNPSRYYDAGNGNYLGLNCPFAFLPPVPADANDPAPCTTTNIGGGLLDAGREFSGPEPVRLNSLWVVVLLTDGVANAGYGGSPSTYYCPGPSSGDNTWYGGPTVPFLCNDAISATRHGPSTSSDYDAEDYAYDEADFVGKPTADGGQGAYLYTIGLGPQVTKPSPVPPFDEVGSIFLQYAATVGNGIYYPAPSAAQLAMIFQNIANNIATVLTK